ncbi:hypothetical protein [Antribacter gilvus]|uniref:hypothetical protein n=1 Tax=Antribacter gilvus TaxID=2304675 RepID=UPI000F766D17|nr:hypothetical protein [Antribacter gilvus]
MRASRFIPWLTQLLEPHLPEGVQLIEWSEAGVTRDAGMEATMGFVLQAPGGGAVYLQAVHSGGDYSTEEVVVEGEPPAPVPPADLAIQPGGQVRMVDVEAWITALVINSQLREIAEVQRYSTRPNRGAHPFGFNVIWHSGAASHVHLLHTLRAGERRSADNKYRVLEVV